MWIGTLGGLYKGHDMAKFLANLRCPSERYIGWKAEPCEQGGEGTDEGCRGKIYQPVVLCIEQQS